MERVTEPKKSIITDFFNTYQVVRRRPEVNVYPQMPLKQIQHFIKQAAQTEQQVIVQMNPSSFSKQINEVTGKLSLSPQSSHVILTTELQSTIHLIQPKHIRHIRLV